MKEAMDRLVRYLVSCARAFELDADDILSADLPPRSQASYEHENYKYGAQVFLALYKHEHPANPYFNKPETLALCFRQVEAWLSKWEATRCGFAEWPPLMICRALDLLGDELPADQRGRYERFVEWFVEDELPQPFFFTAPNHEAWKLAVAALAGRILGRPGWIEQAEFEACQLIAYQTPEGFWEEGRHHGPSMKYNSLMLGPMAVLARETGNENIRDSAARLARFMATWAFPDGVTVGAFDGRQSTSPGYFGRVTPGLELAEGGVTHLRRIMQFWEDAGWLDDPRRIGPSNWYAYFGMPFAAESLVYYASWLRSVGDLGGVAGQADGAARSAPALPMDHDGTALENHTPYFDGVMRRTGPWAVALSGQLSDVPKDTLFIYRLERQSRIEVWHERASVVIGGGHNTVEAEHPLCNVLVEPGWHDDPDGAYAGQDKGDAGGPAMARRRSKYYPRAASTGIDGAVSWLELTFAHATVWFEVEPAGDQVNIRYRYRTCGVQELRIALPLVLWRTARCLADERALDGPGEQQEPSVVEVQRDVAVECPLFGTRATLTIPAEGKTRVRFPLEPLRSYGPLFRPEDERFESFFAMAQVETTLAAPERSGRGEWTLRVGSL